MRVSDAADAGLAYLRVLPHDDALKYVKNSVGTGIPRADSVLQDGVAGYEPDHMPIFANEAGVHVVPFGDLSKPAELGLALSPYQKGTITASVQIPDAPLTIAAGIDAGAQSTPLAITLQPTGAGVTGGAPTNATFELAIIRKEPGGVPTILADAGGCASKRASSLAPSEAA